MNEYIKKDDAINALGERPPNWLNTHEEFQAEVDWDEHIAAIKALAPADVIERSRHEEIVTAYINGLENIINELKEEQRWIPCSERLPEVNEDVLVTDGCTMWVCSLYDADYFGYDGYLWEDNYGTMHGFDEWIAWMPIPQPYKEKNDE